MVIITVEGIDRLRRIAEYADTYAYLVRENADLALDLGDPPNWSNNLNRLVADLDSEDVYVQGAAVRRLSEMANCAAALELGRRLLN